MAKLPITQRHSKALSREGRSPTDAPDWIDAIDNPYLHGLFAPIQSEIEATDLRVEGEIPRDLNGAYYRNGPNSAHAPNNRYHWFDGDGMIHGIWFEDGTARYRNRWIRTHGFVKEQESGETIWPGVLGPFDFSLPGGPLKDTANTDLLHFQGRLLALWYESGRPYALNFETLETEGVEDLGGHLDGLISAHSKVDPATGDFIFFSYGDRPPYMQYGVYTESGRFHNVDIELPGPRRPHDIGVTPNHSILFDFPVFMSEEYFKKTGKRVPLFQPEVPTRYGVIPRFGTNADVRWFEFEPCYMLHVVNCYEDGDWVVMNGCRTDDPSLKPDPRDGKIAAMLSGLKLQANLYQWRMNLKTGESRESKLDDFNTEFPMINPSVLGQDNRYAYHQHIPYEIPATFSSLVKYDLQTGAYESWDYGDGVFGSEAPFCARPGATDEDDGYLVTFVTDTSDWSSSCQIFDAQTLSDGPIATVHIPQRIPAGFHATWVPSEDLR